MLWEIKVEKKGRKKKTRVEKKVIDGVENFNIVDGNWLQPELLLSAASWTEDR